MKKLVLTILVLSLGVGCSSMRKKSTEGADSVRSETTAGGGTERLDNSPMNLNASGSDSGQIPGLQTVFFDYDSSNLSPDERAKLINNVDWIKKNSSVKITIEGHTDFRGTNEYNLGLGERRANAVKQVLVAQGIPSSRLTIVSFGEEKPLMQGETEEAMSKNRRANFVPVQ